MTEGSVATTSTWGGVALLERAMGYTLGGLLLVTREAMTRPTPCAQWDLRTLLLHMNDSLLTLHEAIAAGRLDLDTSARPDADFGNPVVDPVGSLRNRACAMLGAWVRPDGAEQIAIADRGLPAGVVAAAGAVEVAVHGWDVAAACGRPRPVPAALASELLGVSRVLVGDVDRPEPFGVPVTVSRSAGFSDRLVGFLGRKP